MAECRRCREAARIAREVAFVAEDLGTLYGIATGRGSAPIAPMVGEPMFKSRTSRTVKKKAKRQVTKYQREFGVQLKKLKKKHSRTPIHKLMKRAHIATKRSMR
jgi:hypothetical protein